MDTARRDDLRKLAELIKDIRVAMLSTPRVDADGMRTRPMYTQRLDADSFDGELWFMTDADSEKAREIGPDAPVVLTYADASKNRYVVVEGRARIERDSARTRELWNLHAKGWWPGGPDDPAVRLIHVRIDRAEYWDGPSNLAYMVRLARATVTGDRARVEGEHDEMRVR